MLVQAGIPEERGRGEGDETGWVPRSFPWFKRAAWDDDIRMKILGIDPL